MATLLTAISGDDTGATKILIAHINNIIQLLNGTTAGKVKLIGGDDQQILLQPGSAPADLTTAILELLSAAGTSLLALRYNGVIESNVVTGTAPMLVASTTKVANLNAEKVDGLDTDATAGGTLVSTTGTETLTNKTLTTPTLTAPVIADFTSAAHDHGDADDGGAVVAAALGLTTEGDILYRNATALARLPKGTAGQGLIMNAGATAPSWGELVPLIKDLSGSLTTASATFATIVSWTFTAAAAGQVVVFFSIYIKSVTTNNAQGEVKLQIAGVDVTLNAQGQELSGTTAVDGAGIMATNEAAVTVLNTAIRAGGVNEHGYWFGTAVATVAAGSNTLVWQGRNIGAVTDAVIQVHSIAVVGRTS